MLTTTVAPLAFEKMMVSCIIAFVSIGLIGQAVPYLQRRYRFNNFWAWIIAILTYVVVIALQGFFLVSERLAPFAKQYDWLFILMGVGVFQGTCRVNRPTMPLFSRPAAPDPGSASPCRSVPSYASDLTSAPGFSPWLVCTAHGAAPGSDGPVLDAAQPV